MTRLRLPMLAPPLALAAALAVGLAAAAQSPAPAPSDGWRGHADMRDPTAMHEGMERRHGQMIADWTTVLKLTPAQAQTLSAAMQRPMRGEKRGRQGPDAGPQGTLQRLDAMQARMTEREAHMRDHLAAMKSFYTALSPDQQKTFDAVTRLSHGGMHRGRMGMGGGHSFGPHGGWGGRMGQGGAGGPPPPSGE